MSTNLNFRDFCNDQIQRGIKQLVAENPSKAKSIMLESDAVYEQRIRRQLQKNYTQFQSHLINGARLLLQAVENQSENGLLEEYNKILNAIEIISLDKEKQHQLLEENQSMCNVLNISEGTQQALYKIIQGSIQEEKWQEAHDMLAFLIGIQTGKADWWLDFGYMQYKLAQYESALESFYIASQYANEDDLRPYIYTIYCYIKLERKEDVRDLIEHLKQILATDTDSGKYWLNELERLQSQI